MLSIVAVSAADDGNDLQLSSQADNSTVLEIDSHDDVLEKRDPDFNELQNDINSAGSEITLSDDYKMNTGNQEITILKDFTINGANHIIDADSHGRIFYSLESLTLKDLTLKNGNVAENGGAIYAKGNLTLINCKFINNVAENGGAVYSQYGYVLTITDSTFDSNHALSNGGAIFSEKNLTAENSNFINNIANIGGAIYAEGLNLQLNNTVFRQNDDESKSNAIYTISQSSTISNSIFEDNGLINEYAIENRNVLSLYNNTITNIIYGADEIHDLNTVASDNTTYFITNSSIELNAFLKDADGNDVHANDFRFIINGEILLPSYNADLRLYQLNYAFPSRDTYVINISSSRNGINRCIKIYEFNDIKGSFHDLQEKIDKANDVLYLDYDIKWSNDADSELYPFNTGIKINKNIVIDGGFHTINADRKTKIFEIGNYEVTLKNFKFVMGRADTSSMIENAANLVLINCSFENYKAYGIAGAIYTTNSISCYDCSFSISDSSEYLVNDNGGAIYIAGSGKTVNLVRTNFNSIGWMGQLGGAIYNSAGNKLNVIGCKFVGCSATNQGGDIYSLGDLTVDSSTFFSCISKQGSAIYCEGVLKINNSFFDPKLDSGGHANPDGGSIYALNTLIISNTNFTRGNVKYNGGAIHIKNADYLNITNCYFYRNTVDEGAGGAIYSENVNYVLIKDNRFENNNNRYNGLAESAGYAIHNVDGNILNITNSIFEGNGGLNRYSIYNMGTLYLTDSNVSNIIYNKGDIKKTLTVIILDNRTITEHKGRLNINASLTDELGNKYYAPLLTIKINSVSKTLSFDLNTQLHVLKYDFSALGTYVISASQESFENLIVKTGIYNITYDDSLYELYNQIRNAGSVLNLNQNFYYNEYLDGSIVSNNGITIDKSIVINGYGHTIDVKSMCRIFNIKKDVTLNNITFANGFTTESGGAIYNNGNLIIQNCIFSNNIVEHNGGAIYNDKTLSITHSNFYSNQAWESDVTTHCFGGAIYSTKGFTVLDSKFEYNSAENDGGAIYVIGDFNAKNCEFKSNAILYYHEDYWREEYNYVGHGIDVHVKNSNTLKLTNCTFLDSSSEAVGGVYANSGTIEIEGSYFRGGSAINGSAICSDAVLIIRNSKFDSCHSSKTGGAIHANKQVKIYNSTFNGCRGSNWDYGEGGALYATSSFEIDGCNFTGNTAGAGGAIYSSGEQSGNKITNSIFDSNYIGNLDFYSQPKRHGGAIYMEGDVTIINSYFIKNSARYDGGAIYTNGGLNLNNVTFKNNTANRQGEAIFIIDSGNAVIESSIFSNNGNDNEYAIYNMGVLTLDKNNVTNIIYNGKDITTKLVFVVLDNSTVRYDSNVESELYAVLYDDNGNVIHAPNVKFQTDNTIVNAAFNLENRTYVALYNFTAGLYEVNALYDTQYLVVNKGYADVEYYGSFTDLYDRINNAGNTLDLPYNFTYNSNMDGKKFDDGITINKAITINGNGFSINGKANQIFSVYNENVVLDNIVFYNSTAFISIIWYSQNGALINCKFINNSNDAYVIRWNGINGNMTNCTFINCLGKNRVVYSFADSLTISGCYFADNCGAVFSSGGYINIINSTFINNTCNSNGGAVAIEGINFTIENSRFINNKASSGGAVYSTTTGIIKNSKFYQNAASHYGNAIYIYDKFLTIIDSIIENNGGYGDYAIVNRGNLSLNNNTISNIIYNMKVSGRGNIISHVVSILLNNSTTNADLGEKVLLYAGLYDDNGNAIYDSSFSFKLH